MDDVDFDALEDRLGWTFKDRQRLREALTHSTFANEHPDPVPDNERLEFVGDAVLGLLTARILYRRPDGMGEGEMSRLRARVVRGEALAKMGESIALGDHLMLGQGQRGEPMSQRILANAFEAVVGAVFLDGGFDAAVSCFEPLFCDAISAAGTLMDFKTRLQETCHRLGKAVPKYHVVDSEGPDHARVFRCEVHVGDEVLGRGKGRSKKAAEQKCAQQALVVLGDPQVAP